jgi:GTP cyclohydrolase I
MAPIEPIKCNGKGDMDSEGLDRHLDARDENPRIAELTHELLTELGENPEREGLLRTPGRVSKAWSDLTRGYNQDIDEIVNEAIFEEDIDEMVIVKQIQFFSLCEHHLLPFYGRASVAYIPNGKVIGLSKIPRIVDMYSRRLQVQERLTRQIADTVQAVLKPRGVAVVMEGYHMCMMMRGVEKQDSVTTSSAMLGCFKNNPQTRAEFMSLLGMNIAG